MLDSRSHGAWTMAPSLTRRIREDLVTGRLWPITSEAVWASTATGADTCVVCLERITDGVSYELINPAGMDIVVHYSCYLLWRHESVLHQDTR